MLKTLILLLPFTLLLQSCLETKKNEEKTVTVSGIVYNRLTGGIVANIPIEITTFSSAFFFNMKISEKILAKTDSNGKYQIHFKNEPNCTYKIGIAKNDLNFRETSEHKRYTLKNGWNGKVHLMTAPITVLSVHLQVSKKSNETVFIDFQTLEVKDGWIYRPLLTDSSRTSKKIDTICHLSVIAGREYKISKVITERNAERQGSINQMSVSETKVLIEKKDTAKVLMQD